MSLCLHMCVRVFGVQAEHISIGDSKTNHMRSQAWDVAIHAAVLSNS